MARTGHEANAQAFQVVIRIIERVDLELTAVARSRVHVADRERSCEPLQYRVSKPLLCDSQRLIGFGGWLRDNPDCRDLLQYAIHARIQAWWELTSRLRCSSS